MTGSIYAQGIPLVESAVALDSIENAVRDLPAWERYLTVALCELELVYADLRLILQTQLGDEKHGEVPGRPEWNFARTFGPELMLTRTKGRGLFVEFDPSAKHVLLEQLAILMEVLPSKQGLPEGDPTPAVAEARRWLIARDLVLRALDSLVERGLLIRLPQDKYRLRDDLAAVLARMNRLDDDEQGYALMLAPPADIDGERQRWATLLLEISRNRDSDALIATHEHLDADDVASIVTDFLHAPLGFPTFVALKVAALRGMSVDSSLLRPLIEQIEPDTDEARAMATTALARYALEHDVERELAIEKLREFGAETAEQTMSAPEGASEEETEAIWQFVAGMSLGVPGIDEVALLLLEYAPAKCLPAVRRALRDAGASNLVTAVRLVALGQTWAIQEVEAAVPDVENPQTRATFAALLKYGGHELAAHRARQAAEAAPVSPMLAMAMAEVDMDGLADAMAMIARQGLENQADWAAELRAKLPDDFAPDDK